MRRRRWKVEEVEEEEVEVCTSDGVERMISLLWRGRSRTHRRRELRERARVETDNRREREADTHTQRALREI